MYKKPEIEEVELLTPSTMQSISGGEDQHGTGGDAPARTFIPGEMYEE